MNNYSIITENVNIVKGPFRRGTVRRVIDRIKSWNERRVAIRQLSAMSERMLKDIGIERHQIRLAVNRPSEFLKLTAEETGRPEVSEEIRRAA